jgi:hypothetical protein
MSFCALYSWEMAFYVGLDVSFKIMHDWKEIRGRRRRRLYNKRDFTLNSGRVLHWYFYVELTSRSWKPSHVYEILKQRDYLMDPDLDSGLLFERTFIKYNVKV